MGEYTPTNLRSAVDSIRNPFASQTSKQESLVLDAIYDLADLLEGQAEHDREVWRVALEEAAAIADDVSKNWAMTYRQFAATEIVAAIRERATNG